MKLLEQLFTWIHDNILSLAGMIVGCIGIIEGNLASRPIGIILGLMALIMIWKQAEIDEEREANQWDSKENRTSAW